MKTGILIGLGAILILTVLGVWVYLLFWGVPESGKDVLTDFGFNRAETTERVVTNQPPTEDVQTVDLGTAQLAQVTTRPVAGFGFVTVGATTEALRYAERGTGHVYEIDLETGAETRILSKTFTGVTDAIFSLRGETVALITESDYETLVYLENVEDTDISVSHTPPTNARNATFHDGEFRYSVTTETGTVGYAYDISTGETTQLFSIPLRDGVVLWIADRTFFYPKPAPYLLGALYEIVNSTLTRVGESGYNVSALVNPVTEESMRTFVNIDAGTLQSVGSETVPLTLIPEKCTFAVTGTTIWCGAPLSIWDRNDQTEWYRGELISSDLLWNLNLTTNEAAVVIDFEAESGRIIDIDSIVADRTDGYLGFRNKMDNTLWLYRIETPEEPVEEEATE